MKKLILINNALIVLNVTVKIKGTVTDTLSRVSVFKLLNIYVYMLKVLLFFFSETRERQLQIITVLLQVSLY